MQRTHKHNISSNSNCVSSIILPSYISSTITRDYRET